VSAYAQLNGSGYYRIQNKETQRYITVVDGYGSADYTGRNADASALQTVTSFDNVVSDPSSIIYFDQRQAPNKYGIGKYNLIAQGVNTYSFFSMEINIEDMGDGTYQAYATKSPVTLYLYDQIDPWGRPIQTGTVSTSESGSKGKDWYILPINNDCYFGVTPDVTVGNDYYKAFCACFPYALASQGMAAYTISTIDESKGMAVIKEMSGTIAAGTPVIIKCSSAEPTNNRLNISGTPKTGKKPITSTGNQLNGVYFCHPDGNGNHRDVVAYDATTMRVLGTTASGELAFVKAVDLAYIPANSAYITVSASAPDVLLVVDKIPEDTPGDLNGDGQVTGQDLVTLTNYVLSNTYNKAADLNNDGVVSGADYVIMVNMILGKNN